MTDKLHRRLSSVRSRQYRLVLIRYAALGLLIGSITGACLAVARMQGGAVTSSGAVLTAFAGLLAGLAMGWLHPPTWKRSAQAVDAYYRLKDRSSTALQFADNPDATDFQILQIRDAIEHLDNVRAEEVVPLRIPRLVPVAIVVFVAFAVLASIPMIGDSVSAKPVESLENIVAEAEFLEETMLAELKQVAEESKELSADASLEQLVADLEAKVSEMKEAGVDEREALAKLSEMQAAVAAVQTEFNMDLVDANMQVLGEAMSPAEAMKAAAAALQAGEYEKAAVRLEKLDPSAVSPVVAKTVAEELAELSKRAAEAGLAQLSAATKELSDGLKSGDNEMSENGARKLAKLSRSFALRKSIGESLGLQLTRLAESKGNSTKNGGLARNKQSQPSNSWGRGTSDNPLFGDDTTQINSTRREERITGVAGVGPSERGVTHSPEGREAATRKAREVYTQYRKQAEEVLRSESLPLGHRQTIRQYFKAIRPENGTDEETGKVE